MKTLPESLIGAYSDISLLLQDSPFFSQDSWLISYLLLYQNISAASFDDAFEMYAPNFMETINRIDKNMALLTQQNQLLQLKCDSLAQELETIKKDNTHIR